MGKLRKLTEQEKTGEQRSGKLRRIEPGTPAPVSFGTAPVEAGTGPDSEGSGRGLSPATRRAVMADQTPQGHLQQIRDAVAMHRDDPKVAGMSAQLLQNEADRQTGEIARMKLLRAAAATPAEATEAARRQRELEQLEAVRKEQQSRNKGGLSWGDVLASLGRAGDASLPLNNTTVAIQEMRQNPEKVKQELENRDRTEEAHRAERERTAQWAKEHPVLASAASLFTSPLSGVEVLQQLVDMNAIGQSLPREHMAPGETTETLRGGVQQNMGPVGGFLYGTAMSGLDSLTASYLGGGVGGVGGGLLALGAAGSQMRDIKERGGTDEQALIGGAAAGVFEALFESFSIGQLDAMKELSVRTLKDLMKNLCKATVTNASEEAATELANILFDSFFMKELSTYSQSVQSHMAAGMSEQEARSAAKQDALAQIGLSALGGALMGLGMSGAVNGLNYAATRAETAQIQTQERRGTETPPQGQNAPVGGPVATEGQNKIAPTATYTQAEANAIRKEGKTFRNLIAGLDTTVSDFFQKWRNGRKVQQGDKLEKLYLGKVSEDVRAKVSDILGYETTAEDFIITNDGTKHILDEHGNAETEISRGNAPLTQAVIDALPDIVAAPDSIEPGQLERRDPHRQGIVFKKALPDGTAIYVQFENTSRGTLEGRTLYVKKESSASGVLAPTETSTFTPKTAEPELSADTIPQQNTESNTKNMDALDWLIEDGRRSREAREGKASNDRAETPPQGQNAPVGAPVTTEGQNKTAPAEGTGLVPLTEQAEVSVSTGKNNFVAKAVSDITAFVRRALGKKGGPERLYMGTLPSSASELVRASTGLDVTNYNAILTGDAVQHIFTNHGNDQYEASRGQRAVTAEDVALIPQVLAAPDTVELSKDNDALGRRVLLFSKQIGDTYVTAQAVTDGRHALTTNTMWIQKKSGQNAISDAPGTAGPQSNAQSALRLHPSLNESISRQGAESNTKNMDALDWLIEDGRRAREAREGKVRNEQADRVSDGTPGRVPGQSAGERSGGVSGRGAAARQAAEQSRTASARQISGQVLQKVDARSLGIKQGTDTPSVRRIPMERMDEGLQRTMARVFAETGRGTDFVLGAIPITTEDGGTATVRGAYTADRIIIQADHLRLSVDQIADHEIFHDRAARSTGLVQKAVETVKSMYGKAEFQKVANAYVRKLGAAYGLTESSAQDEIDAVYDAILEELLADAYAGINAFGANAPQFNQVVEQTLTDRGLGRGVDVFDMIRNDRGTKFSADDTQDSRTEAEAVDKELKRIRNKEYQEKLFHEGGLDALKENEKRIKKLQRRLDKLTGKQDARQTAKKTVEQADEVKPTQAKRDLRQNMLGLFFIPAGQRAQLGELVDQTADRLLKAGKLTETDRSALFDRLYESGVMEVAANEYYQIGREAVRGGKVYVDEKTRGEFADDWNDFRKRAFAAGVYLTGNSEDAHVDQWNAELAEALPGLFNADDLDDRVILERIVQVAEEGKSEKMSLSAYAAMLEGNDGVTEDEFLGDLERQMDYYLRSYAEKAGLEVELKTRQAEKEARERTRRQEQARKARENAAVKELQQRTLKTLQWLKNNRRLTNADQRAAIDEVIGDIDVYAASAASLLHYSKKYGATWQDLAEMYGSMSNPKSPNYDPAFAQSKEMQKILARVQGLKVGDMDVNDLETLYKAAVGVRHEIENSRRLLANERETEIAEVYRQSVREINSAAGGVKNGKLAGKLDSFATWQLTPMNALERMAGWRKDTAWYSMAQELEEGERQVRDYQVRANAMMSDFLTQNEDWVRTADGQGKNAVWYEVEVPELLRRGEGDKPIFGNTVKVYMTPAQKVHLYLESKNADNLRHMEVGGRTFADR